MASLGMSAGGHLATMVALRDDTLGADGRVATAVNLDGESAAGDDGMTFENVCYCKPAIAAIAL